ncbi:MAG: hypothetical protein KKI09_12930 [Spirochaetes bacterium]|nr:hypothetical protein [Spirochaetota bacterium]MBU0956326.1 hypothetical protein [Spirochaetota bacterium]
MRKLRAGSIFFSLVLASLAAVGGLTLWRMLPPAAEAARGPSASASESARAGRPDSGSALLGLPGAELRSAGAADDSWRSILNGTSSSAFQAAFEKTIPIRDFAIQLWGRLRWDLFRQGYSGVLAGKDGWLFSTEEFQADLGYLQGDLATLLAGTSAALREQGIQLLVVPVPPKALVHQQQLKPYRPDPLQESRHRTFLALLQELDIAAVDLLAVYKADSSPEGAASTHSGQASTDKTAPPEYFMRSDTHWSPYGAALAARAIAERIDSLPCAAALSHSSFSEDQSVPLSVSGDLLSFLPKGGGWFRPLPPAAEISSLRLKTQEVNSASSLFGTQVIPVALVGTSYSASPLWGFENSLKLALAADVLSLAQEGQGPFRPMQDALASDYLAANSVRLVIWEIPERYIPFAALR